MDDGKKHGVLYRDGKRIATVRYVLTTSRAEPGLRASAPLGRFWPLENLPRGGRVGPEYALEFADGTGYEIDIHEFAPYRFVAMVRLSPAEAFQARMRELRGGYR